MRRRRVPPFPLWTGAALLTLVLALAAWWTSRPPTTERGLGVLSRPGTGDVPSASDLLPETADPTDLLRQAQAAWSRGRREDTLTWLETLRRASPDALPAWAYEAAVEALMAQDREAEAQDWLTEGLERFPQSLALQKARAELAFRRGAWAQARADYEALARQEPQDPQVLWRLALLTSLDAPPRALSYARALTQQATYAPHARRLEAALVRALSREHPGARWVEVGRGLAQVGYWNLALEAWTRATQQAPEYGLAWAYLGEGLARTGRSKEAWEAWRRARRLAPHEPLIPFLMGLQALREGRTAWAVGWLRRAVALDPTQPLYHYHLAQALAGMRGFFPEAWMQAQAIVTTRPRDPLALRLAARFCLVHGVNIESHALPWLRRALALQPEDPETLLLLGWAYMALEDPDLSYRFLHRAWQEEPGNPEVHRLLAMWYRWQGQPQQAQVHEAWAQSLETPPP